MAQDEDRYLLGRVYRGEHRQPASDMAEHEVEQMQRAQPSITADAAGHESRPLQWLRPGSGTPQACPPKRRQLDQLATVGVDQVTKSGTCRLAMAVSPVTSSAVNLIHAPVVPLRTGPSWLTVVDSAPTESDPSLLRRGDHFRARFPVPDRYAGTATVGAARC
jgi:hypothetical protein